jgi:hypothetical protein
MMDFTLPPMEPLVQLRSLIVRHLQGPFPMVPQTQEEYIG